MFSFFLFFFVENICPSLYWFVFRCKKRGGNAARKRPRRWPRLGFSNRMIRPPLVLLFSLLKNRRNVYTQKSIRKKKERKRAHSPEWRGSLLLLLFVSFLFFCCCWRNKYLIPRENAEARRNRYPRVRSYFFSAALGGDEKEMRRGVRTDSLSGWGTQDTASDWLLPPRRPIRDPMTRTAHTHTLLTNYYESGWFSSTKPPNR